MYDYYYFCYKDGDKRGKYTRKPDDAQPKKAMGNSSVITKELKKGYFNVDEDTIIRSRIEGHHHSDVVDEATWIELAKDLNRDKKAIKQRWATTLQRGLKEKKKRSESKMWEGKRVGTYDDDEDAIVRSKIEENSGVIDIALWNVLAKELNRDISSLRNRWNVLRKGEMKKGNFDADDDEILRENLKGILYIAEEKWDNVARQLNRQKHHVKRRWAILSGDGRVEKKRLTKKDDDLIRQIVEGATDLDYEEKLDEAAMLLCREKWAIKVRWQMIRNREKEVIDEAHEDKYDDDEENEEDDDDNDDNDDDKDDNDDEEHDINLNEKGDDEDDDFDLINFNCTEEL